MVALYVLDRASDITGVSGTGRVAVAAEFRSGCLVAWLGKYRTLGWYPCLEAVREIHCHHGATQLVVPTDIDQVQVSELVCALLGNVARTLRDAARECPPSRRRRKWSPGTTRFTVDRDRRMSPWSRRNDDVSSTRCGSHSRFRPWCLRCRSARRQARASSLGLSTTGVEETITTAATPYAGFEAECSSAGTQDGDQGQEDHRDPGGRERSTSVATPSPVADAPPLPNESGVADRNTGGPAPSTGTSAAETNPSTTSGGD